MAKFELELTQDDAPTAPKSLKDRIVRQLDTRHNLEYLEAAQELKVGDGITDLDGKEADKLYRAIESCHGPRTAEMRQKKGVPGKYSVKRIEPRPERKRRVAAK